MRERREKTGYLLRASVAVLIAASVCASAALAVSASTFGKGEEKARRRQAYLTARSVADAAAAELSDFEGEFSQRLYALSVGETLELGTVGGLAPGMGGCTLRLVREEGGAAIEARATVKEEVAVCRAELSVGLSDLSGGSAGGFERIELGEVQSPLDGLAALSDVRIGKGERVVSVVGTEQLPVSLTRMLYSGAPLSIQTEKGSVIRGGIVSDRDVELSGGLRVGAEEPQSEQAGILTSGKVVLRGGVTVEGDIDAAEILIEGDGTLQVNGNLSAEHISISGGRVTGAIYTESLTVGAGGMVSLTGELVAERVLLAGDGAVQVGGEGVVRTGRLELADRAALTAAESGAVQLFADTLSCGGESELLGSADAGTLFFSGRARAAGTLRTRRLSFAPDWTGEIRGTLICAEPFEGLTREQPSEEVSADPEPPREGEEQPPREEDTQPPEREPSSEEEPQEPEGEPEDPLAGDGPLQSEHVEGEISLLPELTLPTVQTELPERRTPLLPLLREPVLPAYELLPRSDCTAVGLRERETVGAERGDSYYQLRGDALRELVVRGTGKVYLYCPAGTETELQSVRYETQDGEPMPNLFLIVEEGAKLTLSLPQGESFYGYLYGMEGSDVRLFTGGRERRRIVGGVQLERTVGAEEGAVSGLELTAVPPATTTETAATVLSWRVTGYTSPDDALFTEVSGDE